MSLKSNIFICTYMKSKSTAIWIANKPATTISAGWCSFDSWRRCFQNRLTELICHNPFQWIAPPSLPWFFLHWTLIGILILSLTLFFSFLWHSLWKASCFCLFLSSIPALPSLLLAPPLNFIYFVISWKGIAFMNSAAGSSCHFAVNTAPLPSERETLASCSSRLVHGELHEPPTLPQVTCTQSWLELSGMHSVPGYGFFLVWSGIFIPLEWQVQGSNTPSGCTDSHSWESAHRSIFHCL